MTHFLKFLFYFGLFMLGGTFFLSLYPTADSAGLSYTDVVAASAARTMITYLQFFAIIALFYLPISFISNGLTSEFITFFAKNKILIFGLFLYLVHSNFTATDLFDTSVQFKEKVWASVFFGVICIVWILEDINNLFRAIGCFFSHLEDGFAPLFKRLNRKTTADNQIKTE